MHSNQLQKKKKRTLNISIQANVKYSIKKENMMKERMNISNSSQSTTPEEQINLIQHPSKEKSQRVSLHD